MKRKTTPLALLTVLALSLAVTGCSTTGSGSSSPSDNAAILAGESSTTSVASAAPSASDTAAAADTDATSASSSAPSDTSVPAVTFPLTIKHAYGETILAAKPERIATISWGNQDLPLALGVVPVGVSKANYGVLDDSGLLPWTAARFKELGVDSPVLFDDVAGLNYEAISDADPDVILAAYSGITQEEYDLLSEIAPVVAFPTLPWQTFWRDQIRLDATGMGLAPEGAQLVASLEALIREKTTGYPQLTGKTAAFFYFNPADLGKFYIYLPNDPRAAYLTDLGMAFPKSVTDLATDSDSFALELSAEQVDLLQDIDILIAYGNDSLLSTLQADKLVGTIPAVKRGSVAIIPDGTPLAASGSPSALSIPATLDEYLAVLGAAADKVQK